MDVTIAICTWNRAPLLRNTLQGISNLDVPEGLDWELLVVNNNCTDDTDRVAGEFRASLPLKIVHEPEPGISNARNAATRDASGTYIVWTDDDVLVDENWLAAYARTFREWPEAVVFGGPITPLFEGDPPRWLRDGWRFVANAYAIRDFDIGPADLPPDASRIPFGANFAVRRAEQLTRPYNPDLGNKGKKILLGEETDVMLALLQAGHTGRWIPDARVRHWLPKHRQSLQYLKTYFSGHGLRSSREGAECRGEDGAPCATLFGYPRWALRRAAQQYLDYLGKRLLQGPDKWLPAYKRYSYTCGYLERK